ncbi:protein phosphatase 2C domain-containing protein [Planotetraspora sp. A-T 1434]|uniref:PP2C family protein-serine/threonine phosphatase n=1 Tax=Planotetraspora sp. A-T 1434 TaxID=2979219 RepID=UPI0021BFCE27|nr:protein phosphatase 2C domain-containing protein [Planotetraspora sp. A-T 1434]MCT9928985.1 protein phosphatase 2C domain-containing protein [Planotetraspora sp. A-T 1434]
MTHNRIRYAAGSDVGRSRTKNEDSVHAGRQLLAIADGMGGHGHGEVASAAAISALSALEDVPLSADPLAALEGAVRDAARRLSELAEQDPALERMGTTITAMLWDGHSRFALAHVGDSRAYMLRDGALYQITRDHTLVQSLVDDGRMSPDQAARHPNRSLLLRALETSGLADPDLSLRDAYPGDRYLLCSDGLTAVLEPETLHHLLTTIADPEEAVRHLIALANEGGGPDNITCIVADVEPVSP